MLLFVGRDHLDLKFKKENLFREKIIQEKIPIGRGLRVLTPKL
jgi:hypothetical protein